jgi:tetratricopeptide (TPR) repeat protein
MIRPTRFFLAGTALLLALAGCATSLPIEEQIEAAPPAELQDLRATLEARLAKHPDDPEVLFLAAKALLRAGEPAGAERYALKAATRWQFDGPLTELLGRIYLAQNRRFRAVAAFSRAIEVDPDLLSAYVNLAITQVLLNQPGPALEALNEAIRREPRYFPAQYHLARIRLEQHDLEMAATAAVEARRIRPDDLDARLLEIRIAKAQGQLTVAAHLANDAVRAHPAAPDPRRELVDIHMQRQEWERGLEVLAEMERHGAPAPEDQVAKAETLRALGRTPEAAALLQQVLRRHPKHPGALLAHAKMKLLGNDPQAALRTLEVAVAEEPGSPDGYYWKALTHFRLGEVTKGNAALGIAEGLAPEHPHVRLLRIRRLLAERKLAQVLPRLDQYLAEFPADGNALLIKSELLTLRGDYDAAERHLDELVPGESESALRFARARLAYLRGAFRAVVAQTGPLAKRPAAPWQMIYLHSAALARLGRTREALGLVLPRLASGEGDGALHRLAGELHRLAGNPAAAEQVLAAGLARFPRHGDLLERLTRLAIEKERWGKARDWLEAGIEQPGQWYPVFLERLSLVYAKLGEPQKSADFLARYLAETDPLLGGRGEGLAQGVLFGAGFPAIGYGLQSAK